MFFFDSQCIRKREYRCFFSSENSVQYAQESGDTEKKHGIGFTFGHAFKASERQLSQDTEQKESTADKQVRQVDFSTFIDQSINRSIDRSIISL